MSETTLHQPQGNKTNHGKPSWLLRLVSVILWILALGLTLLALFIGYERFVLHANVSAAELSTGGLPVSGLPIGTQTDLTPTAIPVYQEAPTATPGPDVTPQPIDPKLMPTFVAPLSDNPFLVRRSDIHTIIPNRPSEDIRTYTVDLGDSVFEISRQFDIKPETLLWANYDQLNDNPDMLSKGMNLKIPPVNGVLYQVKKGDTLESIAQKFSAKVEDILNWTGNNLDLTNPQLQPDQLVLVPGGHREFRQWVIPTIPRGAAGVLTSIYGSGGCKTDTGGAMGSGSFIWPTGNHTLSGNDYWSGHLGIDIGGMEGTPIGAADAGVVVYAGWANGGYGNMVMIDHGNGYQTLYAHMSSVATSCGANVGKGSIIGYIGSTGNSTGAHLHFEVRYGGGFTNPWSSLPAP